MRAGRTNILLIIRALRNHKRVAARRVRGRWVGEGKIRVSQSCNVEMVNIYCRTFQTEINNYVQN
jgi:hypothetical protein